MNWYDLISLQIEVKVWQLLLIGVICCFASPFTFQKARESVYSKDLWKYLIGWIISTTLLFVSISALVFAR